MENVFRTFAAPDLLPLWIILGLLGFFGLIVLGVIIAKKHFTSLQIKKDDIPEEQAIQEELDRVLVPIEDEETLKQMNEEASKNQDDAKIEK